jgi:hypothetical protein
VSVPIWERQWHEQIETRRTTVAPAPGGRTMIPLILVLLLAALLFGLGFAVKWLFIVAAIVFIVWVVGFFVHGSNRWYGW